jgi:hypothetical protein
VRDKDKQRLRELNRIKVVCLGGKYGGAEDTQRSEYSDRAHERRRLYAKPKEAVEPNPSTANESDYDDLDFTPSVSSSGRGQDFLRQRWEEVTERHTVTESTEPQKPTQPTRASNDTPLAQDHIGYQMLQKMGWEQGKGIGKSGEGIINPIQPKITKGKKGLGFPQ